MLQFLAWHNHALFTLHIYIYIYINIYKKYGTYFLQIVSILSYIRYILCSVLIRHCCEMLNVTLGVPNATEVSFFWWWRERFVWRPTSRQFMKLNSCICLTWSLPDNLKIRHKFTPTTYSNQTFWFHLCMLHSLCPYNLLSTIMCFTLVNRS